MNTTVKNTFWIVAAVAALTLAINYEKTIDLIVRYVLVGNEFTWNGYKIGVDSGKRVQWPYSDQSVYVMSRADRNTYVQLHIPPQRVDPKAVVTDICKQERCAGVSESSHRRNDRTVVTYEFALEPKPAGRIQKFILVEGSRIWIIYQGAESKYVEFEPMITTLIAAIATAPNGKTGPE
ncbi:MAG: hypothetical protein HS110_05110 [Zoogloeaceae bacterium]|nr:hypothetical protein [Zoogloeaceae bacterium]MCC6142418.1 hypothetical protein [Candidatus Hydrogenedentota bacterium]MCK6376745.1 hypothetical protein [Zoogloea sp.]